MLEWGGAFGCRTGKEVSSSTALSARGVERGDSFLGKRLLVCASSSPSPFRCVPSTDGGSEARRQQGSEQPFPGAPTSPAPPHVPPCLSPSSSPFLCVHRGQALWDRREAVGLSLPPLPVVPSVYVVIVGIFRRPSGWGEAEGWDGGLSGAGGLSLSLLRWPTLCT